MRTNETIRALLGAAGVYVAMAACSASDGAAMRSALILLDGGIGDSGAEGAGGSAGAAPDGSIADALDDFADALTDPVKEAMADDGGSCSCPPPPAPTIITADCSTQIKNGVGTVETWAVASFPGKSVTDLARIVALPKFAASAQGGFPLGYETQAGWQTFLADGSAAVHCGNTILQVTFVLPP